MVDQSRDKLISERYVRDVVDTLLNSSLRVEPSNPLLHIALVEQFLADGNFPRIENANEYAIQTILAHLITVIFQQQCVGAEIHMPQDAKSARSSQFCQNLARPDSSELWGLAILFVCHVHAEWNISISEFSKICSLVDRTARRYRESAVARLTRALIQEEWQVRANQRRNRVLAELPQGSHVPIIGRDKETTKILQAMDTNEASKIVITGIAGVGKTIFVGHCLWTLLKDDTNSVELIWIDAPKTISHIRETILDRISPYNTLSSIREILFVNPIIVILDGIDSLQNDEIEDLLFELEHAHVCIISRRKLPLISAHLTIILAGLSRPYAEVLLRRNIGDDVLSEMQSTRAFDQLFTFSNGNPLGLLVGGRYFAIGLFSEVYKKPLDQVFESLFSQFTLIQRCAWIALALCPQNIVRLNQFLDLFHGIFTSSEINDLARFHLVTYSEDMIHISILPSASYYVHEVILGKDRSLVDYLLTHLFNHLEPCLINAFPLSLLFIHHLISEKVQIPTQVLVNTLELLLEHVQFSEKRDTPRLWYEIYGHVLYDGHSHHARLFYNQLLMRYGKWVDARVSLNALIKDCGSAGDFDNQSRALMELARLYKMAGEYDKAIVILDRIERFPSLQSIVTPDHLLQKARIAIDRRQIGEVKSILGQIPSGFQSDMLRCEAAILGFDYERALEILARCFEHVGNRYYELSHLHVLLGRIYEGQNQLDQALEQYFIGMTYFSDNHEVANLARVWTNIGVVYYRLEELESAAQYFVRALRVQSALGDQLGLALTKYNYDLLPPEYRIMD